MKEHLKTKTQAIKDTSRMRDVDNPVEVNHATTRLDESRGKPNRHQSNGIRAMMRDTIFQIITMTVLPNITSEKDIVRLLFI